MSGEFEPNDSRNVTGTASTPDGRWTAQGQQPPLAGGQSPRPAPYAQGGGGGISGGGLSDEGGFEESGQANESGSDNSGWPGQERSGTEANLHQAGSLGEQIREHMTVVDAAGAQVGTVDAFENDQIKLTRSGSGDGQHHYLPIDRVAEIEGDTIRLHDAGESVFGSNGS